MARQRRAASRHLTFFRMALDDLKSSSTCSAPTLGVAQKPALEFVLPNFAISVPAVPALLPTIRLTSGRRQLAKAGVGRLRLSTDLLKGDFKRRQAEDKPGGRGKRSSIGSCRAKTRYNFSSTHHRFNLQCSANTLGADDRRRMGCAPRPARKRWAFCVPRGRSSVATASLRNPASLADWPTLPVLAFGACASPCIAHPSIRGSVALRLGSFSIATILALLATRRSSSPQRRSVSIMTA